MHHPHTPYPPEEDTQDGPAWAALLPLQRSSVDEATTEVPVLAPDATAAAATADAATAETEPAEPAAEAEPAEATVENASETTAEATRNDRSEALVDWEQAVAERNGAAPEEPEVLREDLDGAAPDQPRDHPEDHTESRPHDQPDDQTGDRPDDQPDDRLDDRLGDPEGHSGDGRPPGDVINGAIALWPAGEADELRDRWGELQSRFVDDPAAVVEGARDLVTGAVTTISERLLDVRDGLDPQPGAGDSDTEQLRLAMRRYREFLERLLTL